jgi:PhzF family phenazine biosynthesis protein
MSVPFTHVDAFASEPFTGNPAAIVVLPAPRGERWMQNVAREMNLSETAFLVRREDGSYDLRWFSPTIEIDLCGHATLASAHVLWETGALPPVEIARFHTKSGLLTASRDDGWIEIDLPATRASAAPAPAGLLEALGVEAKFVGKSRFDYLVEVRDEDTVRSVSPDFSLLRTLPVRGVMITSLASTPGVDFVSRFFAPGSGIDEDPVTGSAHCCLTPYWSERLGRKALAARQLSARGGELRLRLDGDRVRLSGHAATVMRGDVLV